MSFPPTASGRYVRRLELNGTWTVLDAFTGQTADTGRRPTTGMAINDAEALVTILNRLHPAEDTGTVH